MATLLTFKTSSGLGGRCDEKCYNAKHPFCNCCCGGRNHGVGFATAAMNTQRMSENLLEKLNAKKEAVTLPLFADQAGTTSPAAE